MTCLFKLGRNCWIIRLSTILRLWNVCAGERTLKVKECDEFSRRFFAGSEVWAGFERSVICTSKFPTVSPNECNQRHKSNRLCKQLWICELLKRLLMRLVCHGITKMKLKLVDLLSFAINVLLSLSFLPQTGSWWDFLTFFEEKIWNDVVVLWWVGKEVVDCMRDKTFRLTCFDGRISPVS